MSPLYRNFNLTTAPRGILSRGTVSSVTPASYSSLQFWHRSTEIVSAGGTASQLTDVSPNGYNATQTLTGSSQPTVRTGDLDGLDTLLFDGTNDFFHMATPVPQSLTSTVISVLNINTSSTGYRILLQNDASSAGPRPYVQLDAPALDDMGVYWNGSQKAVYGSDNVKNTWILLVWQWNGSNIRLRRNNLTPVDTAHAETLLGNYNHLFGALIGTSVFHGFYGKWAEHAVFNEYLSATDIDSLIQGYYSVRYPTLGL